jgi:chromosomal replication initiation ATPase DnaA
MPANIIDIAALVVPPEYADARLSREDGPGIINHLETSTRFVAFIGPTGTGKTYSLQAIRIYYAWLFSRSRPEYSAEEVARCMREEYNVQVISESYDTRGHRYDRQWLDRLVEWRGPVCVDDLGALTPDDWCKEAAYVLANERLKHRRPTVWTSNHDSKGLGTLYDGRVVSRIAAGTVIKLEGKDKRIRRASQ